jgi:hypothetical protein
VSPSLLLGEVRAARFAAELDLDVDDIAVCTACLGGVAIALDYGDAREVASATRFFAPMLFDEGLALPVRLALERARRREVADIELALWDFHMNGGHGRVAHAVVQRLACQLSARTRERLRGRE